jgi:multidrug efflux pump
MRLWFDPIKMAAYEITSIDIKNAIDRENLELPSGSIEGDNVELTIRTLGLLQSPDEFDNIIIKESESQIVRFKDIGYAELGSANVRTISKRNGVPIVSVVVIPQPGANQINISDEVKNRLEHIRKDMPEDINVTIVFDNTNFVRASIEEVKETVVIAFSLVVLVIFLFLRD